LRVQRVEKLLEKQALDNENGRGKIAASLIGTDADSGFE